MKTEYFTFFLLIFFSGLVTVGILLLVAYILGYSVDYYMREINTLQRCIVIFIAGFPGFFLFKKKIKSKNK